MTPEQTFETSGRLNCPAIVFRRIKRVPWCSPLSRLCMTDAVPAAPLRRLPTTVREGGKRRRSEDLGEIHSWVLDKNKTMCYDLRCLSNEALLFVRSLRPYWR